MMQWIDYHVHTDFSSDCHTPMAAMCEAALVHGVTEIAFTDHFNNHLRDIDAGFYQPDAFFKELLACRERYPTLTIRAGVEVGEPHRWGTRILPVLNRYPYDVVLGSLHWCGSDSMFNPNYFRARSPQQAFGIYFDELTRMVEYGGFDVLAHIDLPKRVGFDVYGEFDARTFEPAIRRLWAACLAKHIVPEINTKGLRCPVQQLHPTLEAMRWYVEMGGAQFTLGSDAHRPEHIAGQFDIAWNMAIEAGLVSLCQFEKRQVALV